MESSRRSIFREYSRMPEKSNENTIVVSYNEGK